MWRTCAMRPGNATTHNLARELACLERGAPVEILFQSLAGTSKTLAGMVGLWSYNGPAILAAVKEANKTDKVKIVAFDEQDETLSGIKDGSIYATVVQQPFEFGYRSMELMSKILGGDRSQIPASKQIFVPTKAIKKDNVEQFTKEITALRGRS